MKKRKALCVVLAVVMFLALTASVYGAGAEEEEPVRMIIADVYPVGAPFPEAMEWMQEEIETRSDGEILVEYHPAGALGGATELFSSVMAGDIHYTMLGPREAGQYIPEVGILTGPYVFRDWDHAHAVLTGEIGQELADMVREELGLRVIGSNYEYGVRNLTTSNTVVQRPEDLQGVRVRAEDLRETIAMISAMGAEPVPVAFGELYTALQQGVVEGQENPIHVSIDNGFHEVQRYAILTEHVHNMGWGFINDAWFQSLSAEHQEILETTIEEAVAMNNELTREKEAAARQEWEDAGGEIIEDVDQDAFRENIEQAIYQDLMAEEWQVLYERIQNVR